MKARFIRSSASRKGQLLELPKQREARLKSLLDQAAQLQRKRYLDAIRLDKAGLLSQGLSTLLGSPAVRARTDDDASLVIATRRERG